MKALVLFILFSLPNFLYAESYFPDEDLPSQNCFNYLSCTANLSTPLIDNNQRAEFTKKFTAHFFSPWHKQIASYSTRDIQSIVDSFRINSGYGENKRKHSANWAESFIENCALSNYPNTNCKAITTRETSQRLLPTMLPIYGNFNKAGQGYPFDLLQNSGVHAQTPLFISQLSKDGDWVLAESPYALGWIPIEDIAFIQSWQTEQLERSSLLSIISNNIAIQTADKQFQFTGKFGAILFADTTGIPFISDLIRLFFPPPACLIMAQVAVSDQNHQAILQSTEIQKANISSIPITLNLQNLATLANNQLGNNYGWGDLFGNTDCASLLRDLYIPFGIWLPRNGDVQPKVFSYESVKTLSTDEKEAYIISHSTPLNTLIWFKGHIMLFAGINKAGHAMIYHNIWGLRILDENKSESRVIIGKTVLTTMTPGQDKFNLSATLLDRVEGISTIR